jgi:hypothetical protein
MPSQNGAERSRFSSPFGCFLQAEIGFSLSLINIRMTAFEDGQPVC